MGLVSKYIPFAYKIRQGGGGGVQVGEDDVDKEYEAGDNLG